jgi:hypothetical protein
LKIDYTKLFSVFPVIDDQFDLLVVDCVKIVNEEEYFYVPIIRFMIRDHEQKKVAAGFTLRTGAVCKELTEVATFLTKLSSTGFFISDVCAYGTVYNEDMTEIEDVNWNNIIKLMADDIDLYNTTTEEKQTYLH